MGVTDDGESAKPALPFPECPHEFSLVTQTNAVCREPSLQRHPRVAVGLAFVPGVFVSHAVTGHSQETPRVDNDTNERAVKALRKRLEGTTWKTGSDAWVRFLSDMKTTNMLNRTGNWVVTDEKTVITGGRGPIGALYVWKLDKGVRRAEIHKYVRDKSYQNAGTRRN